MNPVHDSKDWQTMSHQAPLQTPPIAVDPLSSPKPSNNVYSAANNNTGVYNNNTSNGYPQAEQNSSSMQQQSFKQESDASRLPGMIAHSQPGTPRPENSHPPQQQQNESSIYQQPVPFPTRNMVRGRTSLFSNETGPYFSSSEPFDNLYSSDKSTLLSVRVQSKMDRGFFMADNDWTCYRRNYFQVSSVFSIHGFNHYYSMNDPQLQQIYVHTEEAGLQPVQRFLLGVSARVANSEKEIELIQHTPKRDKGPQFRPDPKPITPGGNLTMSSVANNQNIVTFERVQFKTATANNGKRRAAQQYYVCVVDLYADTDRHQLVKVASCRSAPLVVRGRSPGHYADIQDRSPISAEQQQQQDNQRQHVFTTYQKPAAQHHDPSPTSSVPPPLMSNNSDYSNGQNGYPYYSQQAPVGYPHPYTPTSNVQQHNTNNSSNVSSPISHPPLPSPYAHHAQVPNYAIHDASHNDPYQDFHSNSHNNSPNHDEPKMMHHQFHMQQTGPIESPHSGYDWQRARYNSSSSGSSSAPSPGQQSDQQQTTYFAPHNNNDARSSFSPTTPTYATSGGRKYNNNAVPNLINKQIA